MAPSFTKLHAHYRNVATSATQATRTPTVVHSAAAASTPANSGEPRWGAEPLVPTGKNDPLLEAYLLEVSHAGLRKRDYFARLSCVTEAFPPIQIKDQTIPLLIIESENDPLIRPQIRQALCEMYPNARRYTFQRAGHFPYLKKQSLKIRRLLSLTQG